LKIASFTNETAKTFQFLNMTAVKDVVYLYEVPDWQKVDTDAVKLSVDENNDGIFDITVYPTNGMSGDDVDELIETAKQPGIPVHWLLLITVTGIAVAVICTLAWKRKRKKAVKPAAQKQMPVQVPPQQPPPQSQQYIQNVIIPHGARLYHPEKEKQAIKVCEKCGLMNKPDYKYCLGCGLRFTY
jgi:hypothetical protein